MRFRFIAAMLAAWLFAATVHAASTGGTEHVQVSLAAEVTQATPGSRFSVAVHEIIAPGWHTYWRNPGDSGIAPTLGWTLPSGYTAGEIEWPAPELLAYGPLMNFGFSGETALLSTITVPAEAKPGPAMLSATFSWLVCQDTCIPESANLDVPVAIGPTRIENADAADMFETARQSLPKPAPFAASFEADPRVITLAIASPLPASAIFLPYAEGIIDNSARQILKPAASGFTLSLARGERRSENLVSLHGVLEIAQVKGQPPAAYLVIPEYKPAALNDVPDVRPPSLLLALGLALLGGLLLNLMPCVFPVLSLKVIALSRHAHGERHEAAQSAIGYAAGIMTAFGAVGATLIVLHRAGEMVGWGFQLQSPAFVLVLIYLLFAMGLSLSGLLIVGGSFTGFGSRLAAQHGWTGSFFTGALAALVATPCSAPFMGTAVGYAITQPPLVALLVIEALGIGLAAPYLVLCASPGLIRHLPKPGIWMERLKQALAFPLYGSAVWLIWVLSFQVGSFGVATALSGCMMLGFSVWTFRVARHGPPRLEKALRLAGVLAAVIALSAIAFPGLRHVSGQVVDDSFIPVGWEPYSEARLAEAEQTHRAVFVDMSAAWCITCMVNERVALGDDFTSGMHKRGVVLLKGDWTNQDPQITAFLARYNRNGVPLYVYAQSDGTAVVLPQLLTPAIVRDAVGAD